MNYDVIDMHYGQANYVMKRKADGTTTIRVLMDNKASKNSALHRAIIETGRLEMKHSFSEANFYDSMQNETCILYFRPDRRHTSEQLLGERSHHSSKEA